MSLYPGHLTSPVPPDAVEVVERAAWRLRQRAAFADAGFSVYAWEPDDGGAGRFLVVRLPVEDAGAARAGWVEAPTVEVLAECPRALGTSVLGARENPRLLLAHVQRLAFAQLNGWAPDDAAADAVFGGPMVHAAVAFPLTRTSPVEGPRLDAVEDRLYSIARYRLVLRPLALAEP